MFANSVIVVLGALRVKTALYLISVRLGEGAEQYFLEHPEQRGLEHHADTAKIKRHTM